MYNENNLSDKQGVKKERTTPIAISIDRIPIEITLAYSGTPDLIVAWVI